MPKISFGALHGDSDIYQDYLEEQIFFFLWGTLLVFKGTTMLCELASESPTEISID